MDLGGDNQRAMQCRLQRAKVPLGESMSGSTTRPTCPLEQLFRKGCPAPILAAVADSGRAAARHTTVLGGRLAIKQCQFAQMLA